MEEIKYQTKFDKEQNGIDITPLTYRSEKIDVTCTFPPLWTFKDQQKQYMDFYATVGIDREHVIIGTSLSKGLPSLRCPNLPTLQAHLVVSQVGDLG